MLVAKGEPVDFQHKTVDSSASSLKPLQSPRRSGQSVVFLAAKKHRYVLEWGRLVGRSFEFGWTKMFRLKWHFLQESKLNNDMKFGFGLSAKHFCFKNI